MAEGHPKDVKTNRIGAKLDIDREISGSSSESGTYLDSKNGHTDSVRGNKHAWEKIRGEVIFFANPGGISGDYFCIGEELVNGETFQMWVETTGANDPLVTIDGVVHAKSSDIPWIITNPIQSDKNENCLGGEVFITDDNTPPIILNVGDMKSSLTGDPTKYFADFNIELYTVNLTGPLDIPIFVELVNLGGGGGLPVGKYQYSLRYVNEEGDRTNWGPLTPGIPVLQDISVGLKSFPNVKTRASASNITAPTSFGPKLRFRVTNFSNHDFLEIRRISYNVSGGLDFVPQGEIVAKLDLNPGEVSIREFIDPVDSNVEGVLADSEDINDLFVIDRAKAIRYHDRRVVLGNVTAASKESNITLGDFNGDTIFPIVQKLGSSGHNDPFNKVNYGHYMSLEKYTFGITLFDGLAGQGFTSTFSALNNFQYPSRRDKASQNSKDISFDGMSVAADVTSSTTVEETFEVFDLEDGFSKTDKCSFKNILNTGSKLASKVNSFGCPDPGFGTFVGADEIGHEPYTPVDQNDINDCTDYRTVLRVDKGSGSDLDYTPKGFGPNYYAHGVAIGKVNNFPSWAKSFSVSRKQEAGRVVCQGIGTYSLNQGQFDGLGFPSSGGTKDLNKLWFFSPDIKAGLVSQATLDDINNNPQNYNIQIVSPLGFFSEMFGFDQKSNPNRDRIVDFMTYARVLHDEGQINPTESGVGIPSSGKDYVAYNKYRNSQTAGGNAFAGDGNKLFSIDKFESKTEGRGVFHELTLTENVYNTGSVGGFTDNDFEDSGMKDFHEPMYIVNIIQTGKVLGDDNIDTFLSTGQYQKLESIIGLGNNIAEQSLLLVDERWEDCIPDKDPGGTFASRETFIFLKDDQDNERIFQNATYLSPSHIATIISDISGAGFHTTTGGIIIKGIYSHTTTVISGNNREYRIVFDQGFEAQVGEQILVRYDDSMPIRVFGGDAIVGETIFAPIDKEAHADDNPKDKTFNLNIGMPFRKYEINPRHYIVANADGINNIQDNNTGTFAFIRQMCIMFTCESRINHQYAFNDKHPDQAYPLINYVMRPNTFDDGSFGGGDIPTIAADNNMSEDYFDDYPNEHLNWKFGGFRFLQQNNLDFSSRGPFEFFSKPEFGFEEQNEFCTAVVWSLSRAINQQDSPGLKTFLTGNRFDIQDNNGEIKFLWDARTGGKGENLYTVNESGICLLLTKKSILSNLEGDNLSTLNIDNFIGAEFWLSHNIGSSDEMWRGIAEGSVRIPTQSGSVERDALYIPNNRSVYRLMENQIDNIDADYEGRLFPVLDSINPGYQDHVTGFYNAKHNQYWLEVIGDPVGYPDLGFAPSGETNRVFVFSQDKNSWQGVHDFRFDKYYSKGGRIYGIRDLETYELDKGTLMNGQPIEAFLIQNTAMVQPEEKEFIRFQANTGIRGTAKPTRIEFLNEDGILQCAMDEALQGPFYLKQYDGWEQYIPRKDASVSATRDRLQDRLLIYKIIHTFEEDFKVTDTVIQYKILK